MARDVIDISKLVDTHKVGRFTISSLLISLLAVVIDGYDIFMPGVLAPSVARLWQAPPQQVGMMFSVGMVGIILGAIIFGVLGDKLGRKRMIVWSSVVYGVLTLASLTANDMGTFIVYRFAIGIGIGGVIPNAVALVAEFTPLRLRASFIMLVTLGAPIGQMVPSILGAALVPTHGWQILLWVGGVGPLLIAVAAQLWMPESVKYLVLHPARRAELVGMVRGIDATVKVGPDTHFMIREPAMQPGASPVPLFRHGLALITPLLWVSLGAGLLAVYFIASWLPSALIGIGATPQVANFHMFIYAIGGIAGGLAMSWAVHMFGMAAIVTVFVLAVPLVVGVGAAGLAAGFSEALTFGAGFCVICIINGLEALMGIVYPTAVRAKGAGWGLSVGRLFALAGPVLGGVVLALKLSLLQLFLVPAGALAIGAVCAVALVPLCKRRFGGWRFNDARAAAAEMAQVELVG